MNKKEFTSDELIILKNIPKKWKYIARDNDSNLYLYNCKPDKKNSDFDCWIVGGVKGIFYDFDLFENLFANIKWEDKEPICIDDYVER